ncbi:MAG: PQQ-binding-like beta-propeller repeat protein, partial [Planctomycetota bacterium]
ERPEVPEGSWPVYGGTPAREAPAHPVGDVGSVVWKGNTHWRLRDDDYPQMYQGFRGAIPNPTLLPSFFPIHPVVDGGAVFFQNGGTVFSLNLLTGKNNWLWNGPLVSGIDGRTNPGTILTVAVDDARVYANLEVPVPRAVPRGAGAFQGYAVIFPIPQRRLVALDRNTGTLVWSHANDMIAGTEDEPLLTDLNVGSAPLIVGDTVFAAASVLDNRYSCYLYAFEKATGKVRWRTRLCTGQQELNLFGRVLKELAPAAVSERDGVLYVVTNLGVAAAVERRSGEILWIRGYPQIPIPLAMNWRTSRERRTTWANSPPIVTEDALYFTPTDSWDLVALDRKDGSLRFLYPDGEDGWTDPEPRYLIGVNERHVYLGGRQVSAVDRRTGKLVWHETQGAFLKTRERREEARGRGVVTPDAVLTMTAAGLYAFHPDTGERLRFVPMAPLSTELRSQDGEVVSGGNLVCSGGVLLVAGREQIGGWYETEKIHARLKQRAEEDPGNPRLALELGDIYATWRKFGDAVREYERALAKLDGVPEPSRGRLEFRAKKGLFVIHMGEGEKAWRAAAKAGEDGKQRALRDRAATRYRAALAAAVDDEGRLAAMLSLTGYHLASGKPAELQALYERMARDLGDIRHTFPSFGKIPAGLYALVNLADLARETGRPGRAIEHLQAIFAAYPTEELFRNTSAVAYARREIERIISINGREVYAPFESEAESARQKAASEGDTATLVRLIDLYPNSLSAQAATVTAARLLIA